MAAIDGSSPPEHDAQTAYWKLVTVILRDLDSDEIRAFERRERIHLQMECSDLMGLQVNARRFHVRSTSSALTERQTCIHACRPRIHYSREDLLMHFVSEPGDDDKLGCEIEGVRHVERKDGGSAGGDNY